MYPRSTKSKSRFKAPKPEQPQLTPAEMDLLMRQFIGGGSIERNVKRAKKEEQKRAQSQLDLSREGRRQRRFGGRRSLESKSANVALPTLSTDLHSSPYPHAYPYPEPHPYSHRDNSRELDPGSMSWYSDHDSYAYDAGEFVGRPDQGWVTYDPFAASTSTSASSSPISISSALPSPSSAYYPSPPSPSLSPYEPYIPPTPWSASGYSSGRGYIPPANNASISISKIQTETHKTEKEKTGKGKISTGFGRFRGRARSLFGFGGH